MPDRVEHGDVRDVAVDRVVERVTRDLVRGLEHPGDAHTRRPQRQGWQERPAELRGEIHRLEPARELVAVGVVPLADDQARGGRREELHVFDERRARVVDERAHHAEPVFAVDERDVDALGATVFFDDMFTTAPVRVADQRPLHRVPGRRREAAEMHLLPVDEKQLDVSQPGSFCELGDQARHLIRLHLVRRLQESPNRSLDRGDLIAHASPIGSNGVTLPTRRSRASISPYTHTDPSYPRLHRSRCSAPTTFHRPPGVSCNR